MRGRPVRAGYTGPEACEATVTTEIYSLAIAMNYPHRLHAYLDRLVPPQWGYSADTVTRSEHKVSKPLKGETGGIGIRTPRVGGQGGMGGISRKIGEICKNTKGRGNRRWPHRLLGARTLRDPRKS